MRKQWQRENQRKTATHARAEKREECWHLQHEEEVREQQYAGYDRWFAAKMAKKGFTIEDEKQLHRENLKMQKKMLQRKEEMARREGKPIICEAREVKLNDLFWFTEMRKKRV